MCNFIIGSKYCALHFSKLFILTSPSIIISLLFLFKKKTFLKQIFLVQTWYFCVDKFRNGIKNSNMKQATCKNKKENHAGFY